MAAVVDHAGLGDLGDGEFALLPQKKRPQVIFELEERFAARSPVKLHALLRSQQHVAIFQRLQMELIALLTRGGAVSSKSKHVDIETRHQVNKLRQLGGVHTRYRVHDGNPDTCTLKATNRTQSLGKRAGFTEVIVRCLESIKRELVFAASQLFHAGADLVGQMERIAHHAPHKTPLVQKLGKAPKIGMKNGVTARNVKVRLTTDALAERLGLVDDLDHLFPRHALKTGAGTVGKNIAMLATLIAFIRNMPLEGKRRLLHRGTPLVDVETDDGIWATAAQRRRRGNSLHRRHSASSAQALCDTSHPARCTSADSAQDRYRNRYTHRHRCGNP